MTATASNRLSSISGPWARGFTYNACGNTTNSGGSTYGYDAFDRLNLVTQGSTMTPTDVPPSSTKLCDGRA